MKNKELAIKTVEAIKDLNTSIRDIQSMIKVKIEYVQDICPHDEETVEHSYIPGSYYDKSIYVVKRTCSLCGKQRHEETSGSYG